MQQFSSIFGKAYVYAHIIIMHLICLVNQLHRNAQKIHLGQNFCKFLPMISTQTPPINQKGKKRKKKEKNVCVCVWADKTRII